MSKKLTLILFLSCILIASFAQRYEGGIFVGTTQYQGDLVKAQIVLKETKPALGIYGRYFFTHRWAFRAGFNYGFIKGDDANGHWERRNLHFRSNIYEVSAIGEFYILPYVNGSEQFRLAPYLFAGASFFHFNPKAEYQGKWYELQPLQTEGINYSLNQIGIPFGFGLKYNLGPSKLWSFGFEFGQRITFTDYLDDVSTDYPDYTNMSPLATALSCRWGEYFKDGKQYKPTGKVRGDPDDNDWYFFGGFTVARFIGKKTCQCFNAGK